MPISLQTAYGLDKQKSNPQRQAHSEPTQRQIAMLTMSLALFAVGYFLLNSGVYCQTPHTVHIGSQATIVGYEYVNPEGRVLLGIPYAQPITSRDRFGPPQRKDPSGQTLAFHFGPGCLQPRPGNYDEDCLYLNIFTPKVTGTDHLLPVYFWIHGGGFWAGSGQITVEGTLKSIVSRGVIVVSMNYRLGTFGFFTTHDSTVPGNMGLRDQIEALNWVKRYISYFGGDPNAITIGGQSAGGMSVSMLTLSPLSQHLFKQAIPESGSAFSTGFFFDFEQPDDPSKTIAIEVGCSTEAQWNQHDPVHMGQMLQCLRSKPIDVIYNAKVSRHCEPSVDGPGGVLPEKIELLAQRRPPIPVLLGDTHDEFLGFGVLDGLLKNASYVNQFTRQSVTRMLTSSYEIKFYNSSQLIEAAIMRSYIDSSNLNDQDHIGWCKLYVQLFTDLQFLGPVYRDAMSLRQTRSPVYLYSFD